MQCVLLAVEQSMRADFPERYPCDLGADHLFHHDEAILKPRGGFVARQLRGNFAGMLLGVGEPGKIQSLVVNPFLQSLLQMENEPRHWDFFRSPEANLEQQRAGLSTLFPAACEPSGDIRDTL